MKGPAVEQVFRCGAHMPTAGGLHHAVLAGKDVGCDVVQVFTKSPQQWRARALTDADVEAFLRAQDETGVPCLASHDTYLINPASADPELLAKSREALADELVRSSRLRIPFVVMHQGARGEAPHEEALQRLIDSVLWALEHAPDDGSVLLLENTAGQGTCLGHRLDDIAAVLDAVDAGDRLGVCLDTCHLFAAGYDLRTPEAYAATMSELDATLGAGRVRLIHANDSKRELGSRVDRHDAIGRGHLGAGAFQQLLRDPRFSGVPVILETPKEGGMDPVNLATLRLAAGLPLPGGATGGSEPAGASQ